MPRQGKSTAAQRLIKKHDFRHLPFARLIKKMVMSLLVECGYTEPVALDYIENNKHLPLQRVSGFPTTRHLLQTLGTDWGRAHVSPTLWLDEWESKARVWSRTGVSVVADDLRFPNEVEAIRKLGGMIWRIERPDATVEAEVLAHASEGRLNTIKFNRVINNEGTVSELNKKVDKALLFRQSKLPGWE